MGYDAATHMELAEIRAARRGNGTTRASLGDTGRDLTRSDYAESLRNIERSIYDHILPYVQTGIITTAEADAAHQDIVLQSLMNAGLVVATGVKPHAEFRQKVRLDRPTVVAG